MIPKPPPKPPRASKKAGFDYPRANWAYRDCGHYQMAMHSRYVPKWQHILKSIGWPTTVVVIDFENYFDTDYSLRKADSSTIEFIMDERYEELCVSVMEMDTPFGDPIPRSWVGEDGVKQIFAHLKRQYGANLERCTVVIQNARYDSAIMAWRHGIRPPHIIDVLGLAAAWHSWAKNGLGSLCKRFGLPDKGDTNEFKGMTFRPRWVKGKKKGKQGPPVPTRVPLPSDEKVASLCEYADNDVLREWELFTILLPLFSRPEVEIPLMRHTLGMYLDPEFEVDYERADELLIEMQAELDKAVEPTGLTLTEIRGGAWDKTMAKVLDASGDKSARYKKPLKKPLSDGRNWKIASAQSDDQREWMLKHEDDTVRTLMEAKAATSSWPSHMNRIHRIVNQCKAAGGKLPVPLFYWGAHTGRWSGGEKINLQNLGARGHKLVSAIRELLIAPPERELVIVDLSAVEARGVAYIAGETELIERFKAGEEIYCRFAEQVLELPTGSLRKPRKTDPGPVFDRLAFQRNLIGKVGILGGGYGMGKDKASVTYNIPLSLATDIIRTYRDTHRNIVKFWKDIERAFIYVVKYNESVTLPRGLSIHTEVERNSKATVVIITLPSGRELKYHNVTLGLGEYGTEIRVFNEKEQKRVKVWGGHLTENIVQAMCRDALAESLLTLAEKYRIPLHVHDEGILSVPVGTGEAVLAETIEVFSRSPKWAPGLPLGAEGKVTHCYGGH